MANPLPKWLMKRYAVMWSEFGERHFAYEDAVKSLGENKSLVAVVLSNLNKLGWLDVNTDKSDSRKKMYTLKNIQIVLEEIAGQWKSKA